MSTLETIAAIVGLIIGLSTVITVASAGVRWLVKHYFEEIKSELKPNSGTSLKDQVTRLEAQHEKLDKKVDLIYEAILLQNIKPRSRSKTKD
jgi:hypothetical protein